MPTWLSFSAATLTFSGLPANDDVGTVGVKVTATDGSLASVAELFNLTVANTNDAPTLTVALADQATSQGAAFSYVITNGSFAAVDAGDALAYSATLESGAALPA